MSKRSARAGRRKTVSNTSLSTSLKSAIVLVGLALIAGCASETPPTTFDLDPTLSFDQLRPSKRQLSIAEPTAAPPLATRRIVIRTGSDTIAYLHGGQWATDLPRLVQSRLIDGFEAAHVLRGVGGEGFFADRSLHTVIQHFEVDVSHGQAMVEIDATLIGADGRTVAEKVFSTSVPAANDHVPTVAAALQEAFAKTVHEIVIWAATHA